MSRSDNSKYGWDVSCDLFSDLYPPFHSSNGGACFFIGFRRFRGGGEERRYKRLWAKNLLTRGHCVYAVVIRTYCEWVKVSALIEDGGFRTED
jgi:hypothetical protein